MQFDEVCEIIGIDKQRQLWYLPYLLKYKYTPTEMVRCVVYLRKQAPSEFQQIRVNFNSYPCSVLYMQTGLLATFIKISMS